MLSRRAVEVLDRDVKVCVSSELPEKTSRRERLRALYTEMASVQRGCLGVRACWCRLLVSRLIERRAESHQPGRAEHDAEIPVPGKAASGLAFVGCLLSAVRLQGRGSVVGVGAGEAHRWVTAQKRDEDVC